MVGHELGHLKHRDVQVMMFISLLPSLFYMLARTMLYSGYYGGREFIKIQPSKASMAHFKDPIRQIVKHRTSLTLVQLIDRVNPIIRGWRNDFAAGGYPRAVFFKLDGFVCARFYRWSRRLSQRASKRLAQNAWEVLRKAGLQFLQPVSRLTPVKGAR